MSEAPVNVPRKFPRPQVQKHVGTFILSRRNKRFGIPEIVALAVSCLILVLVLFSYFYFLIPARSRLNSLKADHAQVQSNLQTLGTIVSDGNDTKATVSRITASLARFEEDGLEQADTGRMGLYEELNGLIVKNALRNTSGPTYTDLEPQGARATPGKSISTKWQSVYPGIAVMVTVEGPYQNLRHFIQDIERSEQFLVINEVELQRATETNSAASAAAAGTPGNKGSLVSLQVNMATYFQRKGSDR
jgi:Tfp pilus assembly protein PilO